MKYYIKKNWKAVALVCASNAMGLSCYIISQFIIMQQFETAMKLDWNAFLRWTLMDIGIFLIYFWVDFASDALKIRTIAKMNNQVRHDIYLTLLQGGMKPSDKEDSGTQLSWLSSNIKQIENLGWEPFFKMASEISMIVLCTGGLLILHWTLLAFTVVAAVIMLSIPKLFDKRIENLGKICTEAEAKGLAQMKDMLFGLNVLRSFGKIGRFLSSGDEASNIIEEPNVKRKTTQTFIAGTLGVLSVIFQILQIALVVFIALQGKVIMGAMASASNLTGGITNGLRNVLDARMSMVSTRPYFEKILVHEEEVKEASEPEELSLQKEIVLDDVSFSYGEKAVLKNLSLRFEKGGKYALTGPSGCGKSTVLKLLLGWMKDYTGNVLYDDRNLREVQPEAVWKQMGYIEQDVYLLNTSIRENITLGENFSEEKLKKAIHDSTLDGDLVNMPQGLETPVGEDGSNLSGGQKQRVAIARALIHDRSILLVDEGTSALDKKNADIVEQSLLNNPDLTLILVSHHLTQERKEQFTKVFELNPILLNHRELS